MSTSWTLTRERLADKALEHCRVLGIGKVPAFEDRFLALETLDALLKELPIYGYSWPKITPVQSSLTLVAATNPTLLPTDYYGSAIFTLIEASSKEVPFPLITLSDWNVISDKTLAADYPDRGYISPDRKLWTWPVQNANRTLKFFYQKVIDDTTASTAPDMSAPWMLGLSFGIAANIGFAFGVSRADRMDFEAKWSVARTRGINATLMSAPIRIEAAD